jgi:threonine dehydrogenase-like Zn-dependent dehydrogenase
MKAVVFERPGQVHVLDRARPEVHRADDVVVQVAACGLCGTDLRMIADPPRMSCDVGRVIGHEISGVVVETGPAAGVDVGQPIVLLPNFPCRRCRSCRRGLINLCDRFEHVGSTVDGGLAEFVVAPREFVYPVPTDLDLSLAALAEPLACVLNGADRARWKPGSPVVILGGGPIGLLYLVVAGLAGAGPIIVSEPNSARAAKARELGAAAVLDPLAEGHDAAIVDLTEGGAEVVVDTLGTLLAAAFRLTAKRGQILVFGIDETATVPVHPADLVTKELCVEGVYISRGTFPAAIRMLRDHPEVFNAVVTDRFTLADWDKAKECLVTSAAAGKVLVLP